MSNEKQDGESTAERGAVRSSAVVRPVPDSQNGSVSVCSSHDTSGLPASAYKDGHLTFSGMLLTMEDCSFENWFGDRTHQFRAWGKDVLAQWREAGYPSLGERPPPSIGLSLLDYSLGVMCGVVSRPNEKVSDGAEPFAGPKG